MDEFKIQKINSEAFCHTCLSENRTLYALDKYYDIYSRICSIPKPHFLTLLCWECLAVLKKTKKFMEKIEVSQRVLTSFIDRKQVPYSLSHLQVIHNPGHIVNIIYYEEDSKNKLIENIKQEIDPTINNYDFNECTDNCGDFLLDNIKKENPIHEIKEENCDIHVEKKNLRKPRQYKYVFEKISKADVEKLSKKIPIQLNEITYWLERERNSLAYKNAKYKCETCVNAWKTLKTLIKHNRRYHDLGAGPFICDICKCCFPNKKQLTRHMSQHMYIRECVTCRHRCCSARHIARHLAEHTRRLQCATCGFTRFSNMRQLYRHHKQLHKVFVCDHCPKRCRSKRTIENHMRRHFDTYECKSCDRRFKTRTTFRKHCETKHSAAGGEDAYCVQCDKQFDNAPLYRRHVAVSKAHAAERDAPRPVSKVPCPVCGRMYARKTSMMNHYRYVHTNQSNYYCQPCDRHFLNRTRYADHVKYKHEGVVKDKNKLCNICGRGFATNRTLVNHMLTHTGERPYECAHCHAKFTQKHSMLAHVSHAHASHAHASHAHACAAGAGPARHSRDQPRWCMK